MFSERDVATKREQYQDQIKEAEQARLIKKVTRERPEASIFRLLSRLALAEKQAEPTADCCVA